MRAPGSAAVPDQLWDPWLDTGRDIEERNPELEPRQEVPEEPVPQNDERPVVAAKPACVRPRVISPLTGESLLVTDVIGQLIQDGQCKLVGLIGGPGSGKSTTLRHLATVLPPWALARVKLVDDPDGYADVVAFSSNEDCQIVVSAGIRIPPAPNQIIYRLAPWSQDDLIEYLLSAQWDRCASVMTRLKMSDDRGLLKGIPELWTTVLDRMARDESIRNVREAIRSELNAWFDNILARGPMSRILVWLLLKRMANQSVTYLCRC